MCARQGGCIYYVPVAKHVLYPQVDRFSRAIGKWTYFCQPIGSGYHSFSLQVLTSGNKQASPQQISTNFGFAFCQNDKFAAQ